MSDPDDDRNGLSMDGDSFIALVNATGQYSLWPARRPPPEGWSAVTGPGSKAECIAYIEAHWTDMRPDALRKAMDATGDRD